MFGFDWPELIIIGIVALIFIGPEDLPDMFRQLGRFTAKLRQMSREFSRAMEQAAKDTGVSDVARDLKTSTSVKSLGLDKVREAADKFEKWDPIKNAAKPTAVQPTRSGPLPVVLPPALQGEVKPEAGAAVSAAAPAADRAVAEATSSIADEIDDDLAAMAEDEAEAKPAAAPIPSASAPTDAAAVHGPHTQALYNKQALRAKVLAEQTEKLKAIEAGTYVADPEPTPAAEAAAPKPAPRKRTVKPKAEAAEPGAEAAAPAPKKAPRKKKADIA